MFNYPYGNIQELNLTWLLNAWRDYQSHIEDAIAPQYSDQAIYDYPIFLWYEHDLYYNNQAINAPEPWTPEHWTKTSIYELMTM